MYLSNLSGPDISTSLSGANSAGDRPLIGDWDGDGDENLGLYNSSGPGAAKFILNDYNTSDSRSTVGYVGSPGDRLVGGRWNLSTTKDTVAVLHGTTFYYPTVGSGQWNSVEVGGNPGDTVLFGDWDGDGKDTLGIWNPTVNQAFYKNENTGAYYLPLTGAIGNPNDEPMVGDWNNDGQDTIALVHRPGFGGNRWYGANSSNDLSQYVTFGDAADIPIAGDWNGGSDKTSLIGVWNKSNRTFYPSPSNASPNGNDQFPLNALRAEPGDRIFFGDWDGDEVDTPALYRASNQTVYYANSNVAPTLNVMATNVSSDDVVYGGRWNAALDRDVLAFFRKSTRTFHYPTSGRNAVVSVSVGGNPRDIPIPGDWNNDGIDTLGLWNPDVRTAFVKDSNTSVEYRPLAEGIGSPGDQPLVGDWNNDGFDSLGLFHPTPTAPIFYGVNAANDFGPGISYGSAGDVPAVGDWDGNGVDTLGVGHELTATPVQPPAPPATPFLANNAQCNNGSFAAGSALGLSMSWDPNKIIQTAGHYQKFDNVIACFDRIRGGVAPSLRIQIPLDAKRRSNYRADVAGLDTQLAALKILRARAGGNAVPVVISIMSHNFNTCPTGVSERSEAQLGTSGNLGPCGFPSKSGYKLLFGEIQAAVTAAIGTSSVSFTPWNEPDNEQFTLMNLTGINNPETGMPYEKPWGGVYTAGRYYAYAAEVLGGTSRLIAGDFAGLEGNISAYNAGINAGSSGTVTAQRWALHTYDRPAFGNLGSMEAAVGSTVWATEIGLTATDSANAAGSFAYGAAVRSRAAGTPASGNQPAVAAKPTIAFFYHLTSDDTSASPWDTALTDDAGRARPVLCGLGGLPQAVCLGNTEKGGA